MTNKSIDKFRLVHWNARSILQRYQDLEKQSTQFDCIAVSETWLKPQFDFLIKGFDTVRRDRINGRGGGTAILVSHSFKYREVSVAEDCGGKVEACAIEIFFSRENLFVISCYRPPQGGQISENDWLRFFTQFDDINGTWEEAWTGSLRFPASSHHSAP